jgi:hypothetical protein
MTLIQLYIGVLRLPHPKVHPPVVISGRMPYCSVSCGETKTSTTGQGHKRRKELILTFTV